MLRKLIIISCLLVPVLTFSQRHKPRNVALIDQDKTDFRQINAPLPRLKVLTTKGKFITEKTVDNNANLFIMMFNPTCEHCEAMTQALEDNIKLFKKSKIVMVAASMMQPYLGDFEKTHKTDKYRPILVGTDSSKIIDKLFNYNTLPQINVYNHDRKLIRVFSSLETVDSLKQYIE